MNATELANPSVLSQPVYEPGKPIEDVARELGLDPHGILKLASNENPFGASPGAMTALREALGSVHLYPDGGTFALRASLSQHYGLKPEMFVVGNGSNELLELIGHVYLRPGDEVVMGAPAFIVYKLVTLLFGAKPVEVPLTAHRHDLEKMRQAITTRTRLVFLASPNNPTGTANEAAEIIGFVRSLPAHVIFVLDEAYAEYVENAPDLRPLIAEGRNVICLRTFSKIYGLAALRVGYGYMNAEVAALLARVRQPFNVNSLAQAAAVGALTDTGFVAACVKANREGGAQLEQGLARLGVETVPGLANFILAKVGDGAAVFQALQKRGVIVRPLGPYKMPEWIRITIGRSEDNDRLLRELSSVLRAT